ncbi:MAG: low molecular weight protein-tyrosine-phosphatase [Haliscomenobacter sp.]
MHILMVCLGNICRSPLAEGILKEKARAAGLDWHVDSAGTGGWHSGEQPDRRSIAVARKYGVDISGQRARQFHPRDFQRFDLIFAMDESNLRDLRRLAPTPDDAARVRLLLEYAHGSPAEVPDPYYHDDTAFEEVFHLLDAACGEIMGKL